MVDVPVPQVHIQPVEVPVDVPQPQFVERHVLVPHVVEQEVVVMRQVPVQEYVDIPMPNIRVETVERQVHVPQTVIQDVVREVRVPMVQERIRHVRKQVVQTVEKIVHVPQLQHVEVPEVTVREFTRQPSVTAFPLVSANVPMASVVVSAPATTVATIPPPVLQNSVSIPLLPAMTPPAPAPREVRIMPSTTPGRP